MMILKDMLKGFRTQTEIDVRIDNYFACKIDTVSNYTDAIKDEILNSEVEDYIATGFGKMVISVKRKDSE